MAVGDNFDNCLWRMHLALRAFSIENPTSSLTYWRTETYAGRFDEIAHDPTAGGPDSFAEPARVA